MFARSYKIKLIMANPTENHEEIEWHRHFIQEELHKSFQYRKLLDVTLVSSTKKIEAHRIMLSIFSNYFHRLFESEPNQCKEIKQNGIFLKIYSNLQKFQQLNLMSLIKLDLAYFRKSSTSFTQASNRQKERYPNNLKKLSSPWKLQLE